MARGRPRKVVKADDGRIASAEFDPSAKRIETFDERDPEDDFVDSLDGMLDTPFYTLNKMIPQFRQRLISHDPKHWYVRWFFPNAEGGPVYVDYPKGKQEIEICQKKAEIMKELGCSYKIFRPEEDRKLQEVTAYLEPDAEIPAQEVF